MIFVGSICGYVYDDILLLLMYLSFDEFVLIPIIGGDSGKKDILRGQGDSRDRNRTSFAGIYIVGFGADVVVFLESIILYDENFSECRKARSFIPNHQVPKTPFVHLFYSLLASYYCNLDSTFIDAH